MRIEISAGGIGGISVVDFQSDMQAYISNAESVISSFKAIQSSTCNLNGGVGSLQGALDEIDQRVASEAAVQNQARHIQSKAAGFIQLAERIDKQVAVDVNQNKDELYRVNPWLRPSASVEDTPWYEDAWNWLCDKGEQICDGLKKAWDWTKDTAKKAWDGLVEFYNENKHLCQILIGVAAIAVAVVVTVVTGGAAVPALLAMAKAAITAGLISAAIGGSISAVMTLASGESLEVALENALNSAMDGFCSGFMWGGIFAGASQIITCLKPAPIKGTVSPSEQMDINRKTGAEFEEKNFNRLSKKYKDSQQQITIETPSGTKTRVDYIGRDKNGGIVIREFKSSQSAPLTKNQVKAFPELFDSGGTVKGAGKGIFSNGFSIPPGTEVKIIRPNNISTAFNWESLLGVTFGQAQNIIDR